MGSNHTLLRHIDNEVAEQLEKLVRSLRTSEWTPEHVRDTDDGKARYAAAHRKIKAATRDRLAESLYAFLCAASGILILPSLITWSTWATTEGRSMSGLIPALVMFLNVMSIGAAIFIGHWAERSRRARCAQPEILTTALPFLPPQTSLEEPYTRAVGAVLSQWELLGEKAGGELLDQLRDILAGSRRIAMRQEEVTRATNDETAAMVEADCRSLASRAATANDERAREMLQEAALLCEERLERVRVIEPLRQRLSAQQVRVQELFRSVQSGVAGLTLASPLSSVPARDHRDLERAVTKIQTQTRAVEAAVQEVLVLHTEN